ncbi:MAG TPA: hypothetical protein VGR08_07625 [Thermomicrobiales bacterium]|nr:hypothetical protein [Thermomicrobiales bacterium]
MADQCAGHRKDGSRCRGTALPGKRSCFIHDPDLAQRRQEGAARGGRHKATEHRVRRDLRTDRLEPGELEGLLCRSLVETARGEMPPAVLSALAAGVRAYVAVREAGTMDERLSMLEAVAELEKARSA